MVKHSAVQSGLQSQYDQYVSVLHGPRKIKPVSLV